MNYDVNASGCPDPWPPLILINIFAGITYVVKSVGESVRLDGGRGRLVPFSDNIDGANVG